MFLALAPPINVTRVAALIVRSPVTWNIHTSLGPPEKVTSVDGVGVEVHWKSRGRGVTPPIAPVPRLRKSGSGRLAASVYAVCIFRTAVVRLIGVGGSLSAAY